MFGLSNKFWRDFFAWLVLVFCFTYIAYVLQSNLATTRAASGDIYLLWDGPSSTIPAGWTCASCDPIEGGTTTSTFFNAFPRASSTFGTATSGSDFVTHTLTFSASTTGAGALLFVN